MGAAEAVSLTWTGMQAAKTGFIVVKVVLTKGKLGAYTKAWGFIRLKRTWT